MDPANRTHDIIALTEQVSAHNYHPLPVVLARAEREWVWDVDDRRYLDCLSAYSAVNQGHRHPRILAAALEQMGRLTLTSRAFHNDRMGDFLAKLTTLAGYEMALPMNTGAEAVETALKLARKWGYRVKGVPAGQAHIVVASGNFHGRTTTVCSFSTDDDCRGDYGPYTPGFSTIPYGDARALEAALTPNTVAFLVEPIQGEAGVLVPPPGYLAEVVRLCRARNVLSMFDEIQTGLARTGQLFCWQHEGSEARPDVMVLGKALGGGVYPVSACLADRAILSVFQPGQHGSTFGGNPLAAAVGLASLDVLVDERLAERAERLGQVFRGELASLPATRVKDVRGKGLLNAVELTPDAGFTGRQLSLELMRRGILAKDTHGQTVRFAPPLVLEEESLRWALTEIRAAILAL
jgi:ornithine--oxo-acid transaminase